jgi:hypothetical protein
MGTTFRPETPWEREVHAYREIDRDLRQRVEQARELRPWPKGAVARAVTRKERRR